MEDTRYITEPPKLAEIVSKSKDVSFGMPSEALLGCLLQTLAAAKPGGRFLELGTGTGIATAWLLSGMDNASHLTSLDTDPTVQAVAQQALGADARLILRLADGISFLQAQPPQSFAGFC